MKRIKIIKLLSFVTLFVGCNMVQEPGKPALNGDIDDGNTGGKISQITVTIGGSAARTILPNLDDGFSKYVLSAEPDGENTAAAPSPVEMDEAWGTIAVPYGDWIITATAYVTVYGNDYPAAKGSVPLTVYESDYRINVSVNTPEPMGTGTFSYTARYPSSGTASVKLEPWPLGQTEIFNDNANNAVQTLKNYIPSGMYFLTITATAHGKTVIRNEIVHIYQSSVTNADCVFTKLDFGETDLNLSGSVTVLVNGVQPDQAYLSIVNHGSIPIIFSGNDGSGTWSISINDLGVANSISFRAGPSCNDSGTKEFTSIPVPVDDLAGIDLGTVELNITPLTVDTWVDGEIVTSGAEDFYSINVTQGEAYYFWLNTAYAGDGSKSLDGSFVARDSNDSGGFSGFSSSYAWNDPASFIADANGTVYIKVRAMEWRNTGTYAIAYSTNSHWHNNSFNPTTAVPLTEDVWVDGEITTSSAEDWYSVDVTEGQTYYFWFHNGNNGDGSKSLPYGYVRAYNSGGAQLLIFSSGTWDYTNAITPNSTKIYIRVSNGIDTGTYAIVYSTTDNRPDN